MNHLKLKIIIALLVFISVSSNLKSEFLKSYDSDLKLLLDNDISFTNFRNSNFSQNKLKKGNLILLDFYLFFRTRYNICRKNYTGWISV